MPAATASQAWAILTRHARDEIASLRLQELCRDRDRVSSLVAVHNSLFVDLSRQRMTLDTLNHLLRLAAAREIPKYIRRLSWGQNDPYNPIIPLRIRRQVENKGGKNTRFQPSKSEQEETVSSLIPSMHLALRAPTNAGLEMLTADGVNALTAIESTHQRIQRLSDNFRRGMLKGATGSSIRDVIVVGQGVPAMALRFLYDALLRDESARAAALESFSQDSSLRRKLTAPPLVQRRMKFISSVDPIAIASVVSDLEPASTIIISLALNGNEETGMAIRALRGWLLQGLGLNRRQDLVASRHMYIVTGNEHIAATQKAESVFLIPDHSRCEPFTTFTAATLLPLSVIFGWPIVSSLLAGAHDMDKHFVETCPRHNLPVLLALTDVWNDAFLGSSGRVLTPFAEAFAAFPAFVAALESQTCGRIAEGSSQLGPLSCSAMVVDGGLQGVYNRALYQGGRVMPSELITCMDPQVHLNAAGIEGLSDVHASQDQLMCTIFAHADELAQGTEDAASSNGTQRSPATGMAKMRSFTNYPAMSNETSDGNRPCVVMVCGRLNAFTCGQLLALSEHRAVVKAKLWGIDPFVREVGSSIRLHRVDELREELQRLYSRMGSNTFDEVDNNDDDKNGQLNLSTTTILGHYANLMRDQRMYTVRGQHR